VLNATKLSIGLSKSHAIFISVKEAIKHSPSQILFSHSFRAFLGSNDNIGIAPLDVELADVGFLDVVLSAAVGRPS
jgi:hypothetical protein